MLPFPSRLRWRWFAGGLACSLWFAASAGKRLVAIFQDRRWQVPSACFIFAPNAVYQSQTMPYSQTPSPIYQPGNHILSQYDILTCALIIVRFAWLAIKILLCFTLRKRKCPREIVFLSGRPFWL